MPQDYNTPAWFTPAYKKEMERVLAVLDSSFVLSLSEEEVMQYVDEHKLDGPAYEKKEKRTQINWWGSRRIIGYSALFTAPPEIYRHFFPSVARSAIEVYPRGPSSAEDNEIPYQLANSLSVRYVGLKRMLAIRSVFTKDEIPLVTSVLHLLRSRGDDCGSVANEALFDFWGDPYMVRPSE